MADIHEFAVVACPFSEAPAYLAKFFTANGARDGVGASFELTVPVADVKIQRDVTASIAPLPGMPGYERFAIGWEAKGGGPFPVFEGTLSASEDSIGFTRLDLDGAYTPPGGPLGAAFDAVAGGRIAAQASISLLEKVKSAMEEAYAHDNDLPVPAASHISTVEDA